MPKEKHKWLQWPGASGDEKIKLNNKLAKLYNKHILPPRQMDWAMLDQLGVNDEIDRMLTTQRVLRNGEVLDVPMWKRAFRVNEPVYREWCLEFYSSLWIEDDFGDLREKKLIHFRLGGKERHCTLPQFGYLVGMYSREELESLDFYDFVEAAKRDTQGFEQPWEEYWHHISGNTSHSSKSSKVGQIRFPLLRIIHKMIVYSVHHRSTHTDKVYQNDLWLLRLFHLGSPSKYADAPYALVYHMAFHNDSYLCCGNFITRIVKNLGLYKNETIRECSRAEEMGVISWGDLQRSKLLRDGLPRRLIDQGGSPVHEEPQQQQTQQTVEAPFSMQDLGHEIRQIRETQLEHDRQFGYMQESHSMMHSQLNRVLYEQSYYHPYWDQLAMREAQSMGQTLPPYAPPDLFIPTHSQGGFYYPPRGQQGGSYGAGGSGSSYPPGPPQFGQYQGGEPSIFPDVDDMDD